MADTRQTAGCAAALNIKGEHFPCRQMEHMAPECTNHDGWAHSNPDAEAIWASADEVAQIGVRA